MLPAFATSACSAEEEVVSEGAVTVDATVNGISVNLECGPGEAEVDRLGTSSSKLAYNFICSSSDETSRVSFWLSLFEQGVGFSIAESSLADDLSFLLETKGGKLKRGTAAADVQHARRLGGIVWVYDAPNVPDVGPQPEHRVKGCLEGEFEAKGELAAGTVKTLFDVTMR